MPKTLDWDILGQIRRRWRGPFLLKGVLNLQDVRRARDSGVDGLILGSHGGRQMDGAVSPLDILARARGLVGPDMPLYLSGGVRRGTDIIKALALGADAVVAGRAPLYGLCAGGEAGVARALAVLRAEIRNAIGQLGIARMRDLDSSILVAERDLPLV
jgi:(S)-mandelate dehydrogenase